MYIDEILKEKYRVQAEIARKNNHDLKKIAEEASKTVADLSKRLNIKLNYLGENDLKNTA